MNEIQRTRLGFFQSLTPIAYILFILLFMGIGVGGYLLLFKDSSAENGKSSSSRIMAENPAPGEEGTTNTSAKEPPAAQRPIQEEQGRTGLRTVSEIRRPVKNDSRESIPQETAPGKNEKQIHEGSEKEAKLPGPPSEVRQQKNSPQKPKKAKPANVSRQPGSLSLWVVQFSSNRDSRLADAWAGRLRRMGAAAYVWKTATTDPPYHLLRVGFFQSRETARERGQEIARKAGLSSFSLKMASEEEINAHYYERDQGNG
ncbi:MAG: SPOR domain-containing protein [Desulfovibrionales bacterium]